MRQTTPVSVKFDIFSAFPLQMHWTDAKASHVRATLIHCLFQETKRTVKCCRTSWRGRAFAEAQAL